MPPTAPPSHRSAQLRSQLGIVLLALVVSLATACTSTEPPPTPTLASTPSPTTEPSVSLGDAAAVGACASLTRRVLRGLVGAASDRGIEDLAAVEADLTAYLDQRCIAEHWADTVVPAMLACTRGDQVCNREALAPVMKHRPQFDEIIERHRTPTRP
jgi:hypothetical protein